MSEPCAVLFVVGGQSSRMGRSKAWLPFDGKPLLSLLVTRMRPWASEIVIVGAPGQELPETAARVLCDEQPGEGPLAGLAVGLHEMEASFAFAVSCDLPFLNPAIATYLLERADGHDIVVPEWTGRLQPLHAVYRRAVQPIIVDQLAQGRRRVMEFLDRVDTLVVREHELREVDPTGLSFRNINTPEEYWEAEALWRRSPPDFGR